MAKKISTDVLLSKKILTENEVRLLQKRINANPNLAHQFVGFEWELTPSQIQKGYEWLVNLWMTPLGSQRKNNPFGCKEQDVLENFKTIYLYGFHDLHFNRPKIVNAIYSYYVPVYHVVGKNKSSFLYYGGGKEIYIMG